jgi:hypothetical protein
MMHNNIKKTLEATIKGELPYKTTLNYMRLHKNSNKVLVFVVTSSMWYKLRVFIAKLTHT